MPSDEDYLSSEDLDKIRLLLIISIIIGSCICGLLMVICSLSICKLLYKNKHFIRNFKQRIRNIESSQSARKRRKMEKNNYLVTPVDLAPAFEADFGLPLQLDSNHQFRLASSLKENHHQSKENSDMNKKSNKVSGGGRGTRNCEAINNSDTIIPSPRQSRKSHKAASIKGTTPDNIIENSKHSIKEKNHENSPTVNNRSKSPRQSKARLHKYRQDTLNSLEDMADPFENSDDEIYPIPPTYSMPSKCSENAMKLSHKQFNTSQHSQLFDANSQYLISASPSNNENLNAEAHDINYSISTTKQDVPQAILHGNPSKPRVKNFLTCDIMERHPACRRNSGHLRPTDALHSMYFYSKSLESVPKDDDDDVDDNGSDNKGNNSSLSQRNAVSRNSKSFDLSDPAIFNNRRSTRNRKNSTRMFDNPQKRRESNLETAMSNSGRKKDSSASKMMNSSNQRRPSTHLHQRHYYSATTSQRPSVFHVPPRVVNTTDNSRRVSNISYDYSRNTFFDQDFWNTSSSYGDYSQNNQRKSSSIFSQSDTNCISLPSENNNTKRKSFSKFDSINEVGQDHIAHQSTILQQRQNRQQSDSGANIEIRVEDCNEGKYQNKVSDTSSKRIGMKRPSGQQVNMWQRQVRSGQTSLSSYFSSEDDQSRFSAPDRYITSPNEVSSSAYNFHKSCNANYTSHMYGAGSSNTFSGCPQSNNSSIIFEEDDCNLRLVKIDNIRRINPEVVVSDNCNYDVNENVDGYDSMEENHSSPNSALLRRKLFKDDRASLAIEEGDENYKAIKKIQQQYK